MARRKKIIRMIVHLSSTERVEFMYSTQKMLSMLGPIYAH